MDPSVASIEDGKLDGILYSKHEFFELDIDYSDLSANAYNNTKPYDV